MVLEPDRQAISTLYGVPTTERDASQQGSLRRWTKQPTPISTPTNNYNSRTSRPAGGMVSNPLNGRLTNNLHAHPARRGSNPAANATVTGFAQNLPPAKRQKIEHDFTPRTRKKVAQSVPQGKQRLGNPGNTGVTFVNAQYEDDDIGEPIARAGPRPSTSRLQDPHPVPDGEHTQFLRESRRAASETITIDDDDDDPIERFPSTPPQDKPGPVNVKERVRDFERRGSESRPELPFLDLSKTMRPTKPLTKLKSAMKPRPDPMRVPDPKPPPENASATANAKPSATSKTSHHFRFLPIKKWCLGRNQFDTPYHLTFATSGKMTIRSGERPAGAAQYTEELDLPQDASNGFFLEPQERYGNDAPMFTIAILAPQSLARPKSTVFNARHSKYFKPGGQHAESQIRVQFDHASSFWENAVYVEFVKWLKTHVTKLEALRGRAGKARWEETDRLAEMEETRNQREAGASSTAGPFRPKLAYKKDIPSLSDDNAGDAPPVPQPAITKIAKPRRQGSANTPIEIVSPPRPETRLLRRKDPVVSGDGPSESDSRSHSESEPRRRSARQSVTPQKPLADPDEVILVYPPGQTGAVNITNGDLTRLAPGEFLNDTLIEFGLKLWLQQLEKENPELVKQIHVFSSFFYKKLNKKNFQEGYDSVQKWTAKFDLFEKKYIIVPINENLHWYLAIIYHPEHILKPPSPSPTKSTRATARKEAEKTLEPPPLAFTSARPPDSKASSITRRSPTPAQSDGSFGTLSPNSKETEAEAEVVHVLTGCSLDNDEDIVEITDTQEGGVGSDGERDSLFDEMDVDLSNEDARTVSDGQPERMDIDAEDTDKSRDDLDCIGLPSPTAMPPVPVSKFYGQGNSKGKRKAEEDFPPLPISPAREPEDTLALDAEDNVEDAIADGQPKTYVFTLDSLGSRHPKVVSVLGQYLKHEAAQKKKIPIDMLSSPGGKMAIVPHQPNFCDCGIYLLHLAQTFISNPARYHDLIVGKKKGSYPAAERQADWKGDETKDIRERMIKQIEELSVEWKKDRAAKKDLEKAQEEEAAQPSDDDIDIVDTTPAPQKPEKTPKSPKTGKASRLRG